MVDGEGRLGWTAPRQGFRRFSARRLFHSAQLLQLPLALAAGEERLHLLGGGPAAGDQVQRDQRVLADPLPEVNVHQQRRAITMT